MRIALILLVLCTPIFVYAMDCENNLLKMDNTGIDLMVLKRAGTKILQITAHGARPPIPARRMGSSVIDLLPGMTLILCNYILDGENPDDPFTTAVWNQIKAIEARSGYHNKPWLEHTGCYMRETNYLDVNTRYVRKIDHLTEMPYIYIESRFYEPDLLKKALEELGTPYQECTIL